MSESQKKQAMTTVLRLLAATPKSRTELAGKLKRKGFDGALIKETLDELEEQGIVNDRVYARELTARFTQAKPSGRKKIEFELKRHAVPEKIQEEVLEAITPENETERAREIARERWQRMEKQPPLKRKKKVYDFLVRRGFDFQITRDIIEELEANTEPS